MLRVAWQRRHVIIPFIFLIANAACTLICKFVRSELHPREALQDLRYGLAWECRPGSLRDHNIEDAGETANDKAVDQHLEIADDDQYKHQVGEDLRALVQAALVLTWVEQEVAVDKPEQEASVNYHEAGNRIQVLVRVEVPHDEDFGEVGKRTEA